MAWILKLAQELYEWTTLMAGIWQRTFGPWRRGLVERYLSFFRAKATRSHGFHANTALADLPAGVRSGGGRSDLRDLIAERALSYYGNDQAFTAAASQAARYLAILSTPI